MKSINSKNGVRRSEAEKERSAQQVGRTASPPLAGPIPVGTPFLSAAQASENEGVEPEYTSSPLKRKTDGPYLNYGPGEDSPSSQPSEAARPPAETLAKPIQLKALRTQTGKETYRVFGTLVPGGNQVHYQSQDNAKALRRLIETRYLKQCLVTQTKA